MFSPFGCLGFFSGILCGGMDRPKRARRPSLKVCEQEEAMEEVRKKRNEEKRCHRSICEGKFDGLRDVCSR